MKPMFGVDITQDKNNERMNGEEFVVATTSAALASKHEHIDEAVKENLDRAEFPLPIRILKWILGFVGGVGAVGMVRGLANVGVAQAYENAAWLFWVVGLSLLVWLGLTLLERSKAQAFLGSDRAQRALSDRKETTKQIYRELGVPETAVNVDILVFPYKVKEGTIKFASHRNLPNADVKVYVQEEKLYIVDLSNAYAIPLSAMRGIRTIPQRIAIPYWNKKVAYNAPQYKRYRIIYHGDMDIFYFKTYHILEFEANGETWGLYFPCYELPVIEALTGLRADEK